METLHRRCAGLDVHQKEIVACRRIVSGRKVRSELARFPTTTQGLLSLSAWLAEAKVTHVAMEATGVYWKPVWHVLCHDFKLVLANAAHIRNVPGRKSDANDATYRPQSVNVFRHALLGAPDVVSSEIHMFPAQRRQVSQQGIRDVFDLSQNLDGAFEISGVPKDDRRNDKVEAESTVLPIFVCAITDFAEPMDENGARETVAGFAFVEFLASSASQIGVVDPVESEERAFQTSQFAKGCGDAVLPGMGRELAHDEPRRHGSAANGRADSQDIGPMRADQGDIYAPGNQRFESWIGGRFLEIVEATVLQVGNARREFEA